MGGIERGEESARGWWLKAKNNKEATRQSPAPTGIIKTVG